MTKLQAVDNAIDDPVRSFPTFDVTRDSIRKPANVTRTEVVRP